MRRIDFGELDFSGHVYKVKCGANRRMNKSCLVRSREARADLCGPRSPGSVRAAKLVACDKPKSRVLVRNVNAIRKSDLLKLKNGQSFRFLPRYCLTLDVGLLRSAAKAFA